jgi:hypothetical protein
VFAVPTTGYPFVPSLAKAFGFSGFQLQVFTVSIECGCHQKENVLIIFKSFVKKRKEK